MQAAAGGHGRAAHHTGDLGRGESLPLRQKQHLPVARAENSERVMHLPGQGIFLGLEGDGLSAQLLAQPGSTGVRPGLVGRTRRAAA